MGDGTTPDDPTKGVSVKVSSIGTFPSKTPSDEEWHAGLLQAEPYVSGKVIGGLDKETGLVDGNLVDVWMGSWWDLGKDNLLYLGNTMSFLVKGSKEWGSGKDSEAGILDPADRSGASWLKLEGHCYNPSESGECGKKRTSAAPALAFNIMGYFTAENEWPSNYQTLFLVHMCQKGVDEVFFNEDPSIDVKKVIEDETKVTSMTFKEGKTVLVFAIDKKFVMQKYEGEKSPYKATKGSEEVEKMVAQIYAAEEEDCFNLGIWVQSKLLQSKHTFTLVMSSSTGTVKETKGSGKNKKYQIKMDGGDEAITEVMTESVEESDATKQAKDAAGKASDAASDAASNTAKAVSGLFGASLAHRNIISFWVAVAIVCGVWWH